MMDVDRRSNFQHDRMSECRSFSSNHLPCSQSRKMSIGIVVDSFAKPKSQNMKKNDAAGPVSENVLPSKVNSVEDGNNSNEVSTPRQVEASEKENSPWVTTRSFYQKNPTSEAIHHPEQSPCFPTRFEERLRSYGGKDSAVAYSGQLPADGVLDSKSNKHEKVNNKVACGRKEKKDVISGGVDIFASSTPQEIVPETEMVEDISKKSDNKGTETLRLKLWQILEPVSSGNKYCVNHQDQHLGEKGLHQEQTGDANGNPVLSARQNSDVIETDSERPNLTLRRPRTHSLTRKKAPAKQRPNQIRKSPASSYMKDHQEKQKFNFKDGWFGRLSGAFNDTPSTAKRKKSTKSFGVESHEFFHEMPTLEENKQAKVKGTNKLPTEKSSLKGNGGGECKKHCVFTEPNSGNLEKDFHQTPPREAMEMPEDIVNPTFQVHTDQQDDSCHSSLKNMFQMTYKTHSPDFELNKSVKRFSSASTPKTKLGELDDRSPPEIVNQRGFQSFKDYLSSKPDYGRSNAQEKSANDKADLEDSPSADSRHVVEEDSQNWTSQSSSEEWDSESSGESLHKRGRRHIETLHADIGTPGRLNSMSPPNKWLHNQKRVKTTGFSSAPASPEGAEESDTEESDKGQRHVVQSQEDGLSGAVALLSLALERVKNKLKSAAQAKSAEILKSVAEEVHLQLRNAESQIQENVGKLNGLGKTKRKRLDTNLQDFQGELNAIYERFRAEVNQHIQACRSTIEGLEAYETELKRTAEKQRALHKKLLLQTEEAIENQLNDAQIRISNVHDLARGKMVQLKNVLAECLGEGILC